MTHLLSSYWELIPLVLMLVLYKYTLRFFCGMVIVPEDKIGLVIKKFVITGSNRTIPNGRIIAINGEAGMQAKTLAPGLYFGIWAWQYEITMESFTVVPAGQIGLIMAKDGAEVAIGSILGKNVTCDNFQDAVLFLNGNGQKGRQASILTAGSYRINTLLFNIEFHPVTQVGENMVGIVTALDGIPIAVDQIAGKLVENHNNFQDFNSFISAGGNRGLQPQVILAGSYNLNPWAVKVEPTPMTEIPIGYVGVVISYIGDIGEDLTGANFKHGNIVKKGCKGIWIDPMGPGKYPINKYIMKVETVPTTNLVLNWATARTESHNLDKNLCTITVRSKDGFPFNLDVSQIIHVPANEAPKVIARFGSMLNLVSQVLEPTIGNYFRNSAQDSDVITFLSSRKERQDDARAAIEAVLNEYNVSAVDTLIGDIVPPETLMKTLTDRKLAAEQKTTYDTQKEAQITRQGMEKETAIADMQKAVVAATQSVEIANRNADAMVKTAEGNAQATVKKAEGDAKAIEVNAAAKAKAFELEGTANAKMTTLNGEAEASKIKAIGESTADAYKLSVEAMGAGNFTKLKVTEELAKGKVKLIPEVLIQGSNGSGPIEGMLGMKLMDMLNPKAIAEPETNINEKQ